MQSQEPPILLPVSESVERAIKVLDHIPPYNTHKIGVVYVAEDQVGEESNALAVIRNCCCRNMNRTFWLTHMGQ